MKGRKAAGITDFGYLPDVFRHLIGVNRS